MVRVLSSHLGMAVSASCLCTKPELCLNANGIQSQEAILSVFLQTSNGYLLSKRRVGTYQKYHSSQGGHFYEGNKDASVALSPGGDFPPLPFIVRFILATVFFQGSAQFADISAASIHPVGDPPLLCGRQLSS